MIWAQFLIFFFGIFLLHLWMYLGERSIARNIDRSLHEDITKLRWETFQEMIKLNESVEKQIADLRKDLINIEKSQKL